MRFSTLTAALIAAPLMAAAGMYREPVIDLDSRAFKKVMANEHAAMVAFVAPWCGHCQNLAPEFSAAASSLSPLIPFYTVDCDASQNKALCAEYGVQGFPTIKAFPRASKGAARAYNGERKRGALIDYAKGMVPDRVKKLRADGKLADVLDRFLGDKSTLPHALLVHPSQPSIPFLWKVLGHRLTGKAHLGYIKDTPKQDVISALNLETGGDGARLLYWEAGADRPSVTEYDGALKFNAIIDWLESAIGGDIPEVTEKRERGEAKPKGAKAEAGAGEAEDAAARRARLQAKLDEAERRDRLRREKLAAKQAIEDEEEGGTPVKDAPDAQPEEGADEEEPTETPLVHHLEHVDKAEEFAEPREGGTPVEDAPPAEPAEGAEDEDSTQAADWDSWPEVNSVKEESHPRDEL